MLKSDAACSLDSKTNEVVRWIGTARAPVAGSGAAPAWTARVSKPGLAEPAMAREVVCDRRLWANMVRPTPQAARRRTVCLRQLTAEKTMKVSDILRVKGDTLFTVAPDEPLSSALNVMSQHDIGSLVVMNGGELAGMLTFREVIQAVVNNGGALGNTRVRDVMDSTPLICSPQTELDDVRRMMLGRHARYMPAVAEKTLMGVVSFYDVAKAVVDSQDFENRMLKAYIRDWPVDSRDEEPSASANCEGAAARMAG